MVAHRTIGLTVRDDRRGGRGPSSHRRCDTTEPRVTPSRRRTLGERLNAESLRTKFFNPVAAQQLKEASANLNRVATRDWARCDVEITTSPRNAESVAGTARRVGVFLGVSEHQFKADPVEHMACIYLPVI